MEKLGLSVEEAAEVIGIGRSEIYERMGHGEIESVKIGCPGHPDGSGEAVSSTVLWLRL
jgi:excisionase family DNA binding protein